MIAAVIVFLALVMLAVAAFRLHDDVAEVQRRFRVITGGYSEVGLVTGARQRFRDRQRLVEGVVDTSTAGVETAHRTISEAMGHRPDHAAGFYASIRRVNRRVGRSLSGLFAPAPPQHDESLEEWRERESDKRADNDSQ